MTLVSFVDGHRQWFKSARNFDHAETPRDTAFCAHAIVHEELPIVPDALFTDNALVSGDTAEGFFYRCAVGHTGGPSNRHALRWISVRAK